MGNHTDLINCGFWPLSYTSLSAEKCSPGLIERLSDRPWIWSLSILLLCHSFVWLSSFWSEETLYPQPQCVNQTGRGQKGQEPKVALPAVPVGLFLPKAFSEAFTLHPTVSLYVSLSRTGLPPPYPTPHTQLQRTPERWILEALFPKEMHGSTIRKKVQENYKVGI